MPVKLVKLVKLTSGVVGLALGGLLLTPASYAVQEVLPQKIIIDTDPGVDDALAIIFAFHSPELEVLGLTTIFGNVETELATLNSLRLVEMSGKNIPVAAGAVKPGDMKKLPPPDFVHGKDGLGNVNLPPPSGQPVEGTFRAQHKSGHYLWIKATSNLRMMPTGPCHTVTFARDVTEEVRARQNDRDLLHESEERCRVICEATREIIFEFDDEGRLTYVSPAITVAIDFEPENLIGTTPFFLLHPDDAEDCNDHHRQQDVVDDIANDLGEG